MFLQPILFVQIATTIKKPADYKARAVGQRIV